MIPVFADVARTFKSRPAITPSMTNPRPALSHEQRQMVTCGLVVTVGGVAGLAFTDGRRMQFLRR